MKQRRWHPSDRERHLQAVVPRTGAAQRSGGRLGRVGLRLEHDHVTEPSSVDLVAIATRRTHARGRREPGRRRLRTEMKLQSSRRACLEAEAEAKRISAIQLPSPDEHRLAISGCVPESLVPEPPTAIRGTVDGNRVLVPEHRSTVFLNAAGERRSRTKRSPDEWSRRRPRRRRRARCTRGESRDV